jgi:hypothetical protein
MLRSEVLRIFSLLNSLFDARRITLQGLRNEQVRQHTISFKKAVAETLS